MNNNAKSQYKLQIYSSGGIVNIYFIGPSVYKRFIDFWDGYSGKSTFKDTKGNVFGVNRELACTFDIVGISPLSDSVKSDKDYDLGEKLKPGTQIKPGVYVHTVTRQDIEKKNFKYAKNSKKLSK